MKLYYLTLIFNVIAGTYIAQTPITLSNANMPIGGDTLRYTNVLPSSIGNYTQTGINFNWDFSSVVSTTEGRRDYKPASQTPYFVFFLSPGEYGEKIADTLVGGTGTLSITKVYDFYKKQTTPVNAFVADGMGMTISGLPVPSYFSDKDELYNFPMSYPQYDSSTFKFSTTTSGLLPIKYSKAGYRATTVDGWGNVKTPYGNENCLRLITTQYSMDTTAITVPGFPAIKFGVQNNERSYQWMTLNSKIPYMEITGILFGTNFTINTIRYRGYKIGGITTGIFSLGVDKDVDPIKMYPNPVKDQLWLYNIGEGTSSFQICDTQGKIIRNASVIGFGELNAIDVADLNSGIYILKITNPSSTNYLKFIKAE